MNETLKKIVQQRVFDKLIQVSEEDYDYHSQKSANHYNYEYMTLSCGIGFFIYHIKKPPDTELLVKVIKDNKLKDFTVKQQKLKNFDKV